MKLSVAQNASCRSGFSLIEVLLALTIFLLALVVLGRLVDMGADRETESRFKTQGTRLALAKLAEFESGAISLDETNGTFEGDDSTWSWSASAETQSTPNLYHVTVKVTRDFKGQDFSVTLSQLILDPSLFGKATEATRPDGESGGMP